MPRTNRLNPLDIAPDSSQVLVARLRDHHNILNPYTSNILVSLEDIMVDVLRVAYGS